MRALLAATWLLVLGAESVTLAGTRVPDLARIERMTKNVRAAVLVEADTAQPLFLHHPDEQFPPASTVKLMLLLLAAEELEAGARAPEDTVVVSLRSFKTGGQQLYLAEGDTFTLDAMALATAIHSANDAAVSLAEGLFGSYERAVAMMNARAADLGLTVTRFHTPHGLPASWGQHGDRSCAWDLALLGCEAVRHPTLLRWTSTRRAALPGRDLIMINSNDLLDPEGGVDGLKTGFTQRAKYCLVATARRGDRRLVCAILGAESSRERFDLARGLFRYGFERCEPDTILAAGAPLARRVITGDRHRTEVQVAAAESIVLHLDPEGSLRPTVHVAVTDTLRGPFAVGEPVGEVIVLLGTRVAARVPARLVEPETIVRDEDDGAGPRGASVGAG